MNFLTDDLHFFPSSKSTIADDYYTPKYCLQLEESETFADFYDDYKEKANKTMFVARVYLASTYERAMTRTIKTNDKSITMSKLHNSISHNKQHKNSTIIYQDRNVITEDEFRYYIEIINREELDPKVGRLSDSKSLIEKKQAKDDSGINNNYTAQNEEDDDVDIEAYKKTVLLRERNYSSRAKPKAKASTAYAHFNKHSPPKGYKINKSKHNKSSNYRESSESESPNSVHRKIDALQKDEYISIKPKHSNLRSISEHPRQGDPSKIINLKKNKHKLFYQSPNLTTLGFCRNQADMKKKVIEKTAYSNYTNYHKKRSDLSDQTDGRQTIISEFKNEISFKNPLGNTAKFSEISDNTSKIINNIKQEFKTFVMKECEKKKMLEQIRMPVNTNPYGVGWTKNVLKTHYNLLLEEVKNAKSVVKPHWKIRRIGTPQKRNNDNGHENVKASENDNLFRRTDLNFFSSHKGIRSYSNINMNRRRSDNDTVYFGQNLKKSIEYYSPETYRYSLKKSEINVSSGMKSEREIKLLVKSDILEGQELIEYNDLAF